MLDYLQSDANNSWPNVTFDLQADNEGAKVEYKTFRDNPTLSVYYNFPPSTPDQTSLMVQGQVTCTSTTYTSLPEPQLSAVGVDNNPTPLQITLNPILGTTGGVGVRGVSHPTGASNTRQYMNVTTPLTNGTAYQFRVSATNNPRDGTVDNVTVPPLTSGESAWYPFTVLTGPTAPPTISSFDYPQGQWGQPAGAPGVFTVGTNGQSNIAGFAYSFDGGATEPVLGDSVNANGGGNPIGELALNQGGTAQIQVPQTLIPGQHTLYVESFDKAHNASKEAAYTFYVTPNYQETSQPVAYTDASSLVSSASVGGGAALSMVQSQADTCCNITTWRGGSQLFFDSTAWQLGADMTTSKNYGEVRVDLDQYHIRAVRWVQPGDVQRVPGPGHAGLIRASTRTRRTSRPTTRR